MLPPSTSVAVPQLPMFGDSQPHGESGFETVIIQRDVVLEKRPAGPVASLPRNEQFHAEETRVLSREQVDFLKLMPQKAQSPAPQPAAKVSEFHEQATQILDARSFRRDERARPRFSSSRSTRIFMTQQPSTSTGVRLSRRR